MFKMNQIKRLPFELQASLFLSSSSLPSSYSFSRQLPLCPSSSSSSSITTNTTSKLISRRFYSTLPPTTLIESEAISIPPPIINLFEDITELYNEIPLSSLDYPQAPRSPESSLYFLLKSGKFDEATLLLREIQSTSQKITTRTLFLKHSYWLLNNKSSNSSEWLEWWDISPSVKSLVGRLTSVRVIPLEKIVDQILKKVSLKSDDYETVRTLGARAAGRGFYRLVARRLLLPLVAHASPELSEEVWNSCLRSYKQRGYIENGAAGKERMRYKLKSPAGYARWRARVDFRVLQDKRGEMIRMHAAMGKLDLAVQILESTTRLDPSSQVRINVGKLTYVDLLDRTAHSNRLDLFTRVYTALVDTKSRYHRRIRLRGRLLGAKPKSLHLEQTAKEAFTYFRQPLSASLVALNKSPLTAFGISNLSQEFDLAIREAILVKDLVKATESLSECMQSNRLPSLDTAANFIALTEINDNTSFYQSILTLLNDSKSQKKPRMRAYWATALMLVHYRNQNYQGALNLFASVFDLSGLPQDFQEVLQFRIKRDKFIKGSINHLGIYPDAHTSSLAIQALITLSPSFAQNLYPSLIQNSFKIRPRTPPLPLQDGESLPSSPLDPYTFIPFLQAFSKEGRPPIELLKILYDMRSLGLTASKHHWGVVLGSFARHGEVDSLVYLVRLLEQQLVSEEKVLSVNSTKSSSSSLSEEETDGAHLSTTRFSTTSILEELQVSPDILAITSRLFLPKLVSPKSKPPPPSTPSLSPGARSARLSQLLDPAIYTNIIVGLGRKGELITAGKIRDEFFARGGRNLVDERMRKVLGTLRRRELDLKGRVSG